MALDNQPICKVSEIGGITYRNEDIATVERTAAKNKIYGVACTTAEYMRQMEQALPLDVAGLKERYRVLVDFNGTVLACADGKFGVEFVTWDWDFNRKGVSHGHFFGGNYVGAKLDFACRSELVQESRRFTDAQRSVDGLEEQVNLSNQREMEGRTRAMPCGMSSFGNSAPPTYFPHSLFVGAISAPRDRYRPPKIFGIGGTTNEKNSARLASSIDGNSHTV